MSCLKDTMNLEEVGRGQKRTPASARQRKLDNEKEKNILN